MPFINYSKKEITCKIVYYGPGLCGKTTNVKAIYERTNPDRRGQMISLATETDRTLFFDLFSLDLAKNFGGLRAKFQLFTVPGQVFYDATRKIVLKGSDGVVFVADSQRARADANIESLENLGTNLAENGFDIQRMPLVIQYNKRDMHDVMSIEELRSMLRFRDVPDFEAIASQGIGVFETLTACAKLVLSEIRRSNV